MKDIILYDLGVTEEKGQSIDTFLYNQLITVADPKKIPIVMHSTKSKDCIMINFNYDASDIDSLMVIDKCESYLKRICKVFGLKKPKDSYEPDILIINDNHEFTMEVCTLLAE